MFSFKKSRNYWLRSNLVLLFLATLLLINKPYFSEKYGNPLFFLFVVTTELFLILLSFVYGFQTKKVRYSPRKRVFNKSNYTKGVAVFLCLSIFFGLALGRDIPYPSSLITISLAINTLAAIISLIAPSAVINHYESSIYEEPKGLINDLMRYFLVFTWGINYEVQIVLARLPFIFQRLIGVILAVLLFFGTFAVGVIFENS
ncbi:hypothetical protein HOO54_04635 [Bacillus sp. WMMC1349]|uniref:hypothetical protein n=1 Tax=Bacillus sp. WMMC1349 TaxID=2736254 RepID=UPI001555ACAC|nr:hypothetical protein [Bacillus sp. WMMC1349]NPC91550.1 hypothetical protein [Bacillus sp. WMMC1349]